MRKGKLFPEGNLKRETDGRRDDVRRPVQDYWKAVPEQTQSAAPASVGRNRDWFREQKNQGPRVKNTAANNKLYSIDLRQWRR